MSAIHWLGKVSYSLYLIHIPIILALLHGSRGQAHLPSLILAIILSLLTAGLMQATVEKGSQRLGRLIATRLTGLRATSKEVR